MLYDRTRAGVDCGLDNWGMKRMPPSCLGESKRHLIFWPFHVHALQKQAKIKAKREARKKREEGGNASGTGKNRREL